MIDLNTVPSELSEEAKKLNDEKSALLKKIADIQSACTHDWKPVKEYYRNYSPRVDGMNVGAEVIKEFHCILCKKLVPIQGTPSQICRKCGGKMNYDHREMCGQDRVYIHKCEKCGHEYDTT